MFTVEKPWAPLFRRSATTAFPRFRAQQTYWSEEGNNAGTYDDARMVVSRVRTGRLLKPSSGSDVRVLRERGVTGQCR